MPMDYDTIIIGSAWRRPSRVHARSGGAEVAIIEAGGFYTASDFTRFELQALRNLWAKPRWTQNYELGERAILALGMGRSVKVSTTIFTAVAHRAPDFNFDEWDEATGLENDSGREIFAGLAPARYYDQVERETGVRK